MIGARDEHPKASGCVQRSARTKCQFACRLAHTYVYECHKNWARWRGHVLMLPMYVPMQQGAIKGQHTRMCTHTHNKHTYTKHTCGARTDRHTHTPHTHHTTHTPTQTHTHTYTHTHTRHHIHTTHHTHMHTHTHTSTHTYTHKDEPD